MILASVVILTGCVSYPGEERNVPSRAFAHTLSAESVAVTYVETLPAREKLPERDVFRVEQPVYYDGLLILPVGSRLSTTTQYPSRHRAVDHLQLPGEEWTPAQGVITLDVGNRKTGTATLSHVMIPEGFLE